MKITIENKSQNLKASDDKLEVFFRLKEKTNTFPEQPGVYFMHDKDNNLIYIGKSVNLKSRAKQYLTPSGRRSEKISQMIDLIKDITFQTTDTELDALLLECELIKQNQPYFNSLLKNHKKYAYVKIDVSEYPTLKAVNEIKEDESIYIGPYGSLAKLEDQLSKIRHFFGLRSCPTSMALSGCMNKDLGICLGPCKYPENMEIYKKNAKLALEFIKGNDLLLTPYIKDKMLKHAMNLEFEEAGYAKEILDLLESFKGKQQVLGLITQNKQVIVLHSLTSYYKLYLFVGGVLIHSELLSSNLEEASKQGIEIGKITFEKYVPKEDSSDQKSLVDQASIIYHYLSTSKKIIIL